MDSTQAFQWVSQGHDKGILWLASLWSGAIGGVASIVTGEGAGITAIVVAASSVLGALFAKIPDIIKARSERKKLDDDGQDKLIEQIYRNQDREREASEKAREASERAIKKLEAENLILRTTKHEILNECNIYKFWVSELRDICREHKLPYPEYEVRNIPELIRAEDAAMKHISDKAS